MQTFLNQPESTFYHITTIENWEKIKLDGMKSDEGKIFVSRVGEFPVLLAIAIEQLQGIVDTKAIVILKFPQYKNNFEISEISRDYRSDKDIEWTAPFQNIILRQFIPKEGIELMMILKYENNNFLPSLDTCFNQIASSSKEYYMSHYIYERAKKLKYSNQI